MNFKWFTSCAENPIAIPGDPNPKLIGVNMDNVSAIMAGFINGESGTIMRLIDGQILHLREPIKDVITCLINR